MIIANMMAAVASSVLSRSSGYPQGSGFKRLSDDSKNEAIANAEAKRNRKMMKRAQLIK
jgi:hypothetical protein